MSPAKIISALVILGGCTLGAFFHAQQGLSSSTDQQASRISLGERSFRLIGPTAPIEELESGLVFQARIDTGATRCSLHTDQWEIEDEFPTMTDNVGKVIRFRLTNRRGQSQWLTRRIAEVAMFRTSEEEELRYLVPLSFALDGTVREVLVSLNDRSHMDFALLIGRNFLDGQFVVDVSRGRQAQNLFAGSP